MSLSTQSTADLLQAFRSDPRNAELALFLGARLADAGQAEAAVAVWSLGNDANPAVRTAKDHPRAAAGIREASARADAAICDFLAQLHVAAVDAFAGQTDGDVARIRNAIWPMTHAGNVSYREALQQPEVFYVPDLPPIPVAAPEHLPWASALEAQVPAILAEYRAATQDSDKLRPYVPGNMRGPGWGRLRGRLDWSALYLFEASQPGEFLDAFPATQAALEALDLVRVDGVPMEAFFSRLVPGAHIPPHFGLTNARFTVHLPLVIPPDCAIRVGTEEHRWQEGRVIAFDDSFEHEAWNRSDRDRVVLIFETHHPDLTDAERGAIEHCFAARKNWHDRRAAILGWE